MTLRPTSASRDRLVQNIVRSVEFPVPNLVSRDPGEGVCCFTMVLVVLIVEGDERSGIDEEPQSESLFIVNRFVYLLGSLSCSSQSLTLQLGLEGFSSS